jgi:hypothetical protein
MFSSAIVRLFHRSFDPHLNQVQDLAVGDPARHRFHQWSVRNLIEVATQVSVDHGRVPVIDQAVDGLDRIQRILAGAVAARLEAWGLRQTQTPPSARSKTMTDEQLAAMHRLLAEYHRKLANEAALDVVQQYHADLAQRLADEAALIPRRTAILERLREREQRKTKDGDVDK